MMPENKTLSGKSLDEFLEVSRKQLSQSTSADRDNRDRALDDLKHLVGEGHWSDEIRLSRERENRPCLVINQLPQFLRQVTGDLRAMNPAIEAAPADGEASKEVAEVIEGLIRHIQYRSDASSVYERAGESAAACGAGYFRILTEYEDPMTFTQEIVIKTIHNPFSVHFDPQARMATREDAKWCFITEWMDRASFETAFPKKNAISLEHDAELEGAAEWVEGDSVLIAEKFWIESRKIKIGLTQDGRVIKNPTVPEAFVTVRDTEIPVVMWAKITGKDVLEGPKEFPGAHIPVVAVVGEELMIGREVYRSSVIRFAKEPQRLYNYYSSADAEVVALQPKAPFLVTPRQVAGLDKLWAGANQSNAPYLLYNPDPAAPMPQRVQPPVSSQGIQQGIAKAQADMRATTGIYDAALGRQSNESSGVAIRQRQMEADVSTSIYSDNMGKAVAHCGRIIVRMIPEIYDTTRTMRIIGKDGTQQQVDVNVPVVDNGVERVLNDLTIGRYDVRVNVGPNYTTKRQEAAEKTLELTRTFPALMGIAGDLVVKNMDIPGADQIAERLEKALPPGMKAQDPQAQPDPQQAMAMQAQQMQMQAAQAMEQLKLRQESAKAEKAEAEALEAKIKAEEARFLASRHAFPAPSGPLGQQPL